MKKILFGVLVGAAAVLAVLGVHVVRDSQGTFVVGKQTWTLERTYVDARSLGVGDFLKLPAPVRQQLASRKAAAVRGKVEGALEGLR